MEVMAVLAIWGVDQQMGALCLSFTDAKKKNYFRNCKRQKTLITRDNEINHDKKQHLLGTIKKKNKQTKKHTST